MMMESGFLICRYHRTPPGLASPGITMFKNPTSEFQMFKGTDPSERARGGGACCRSPPGHGQIDIASAVFRVDKAVARARIEDRRHLASLPSSTPSLVLPKFRPKLSSQEFSAPERRGIARSFATIDTTTCFAKVSVRTFVAEIFSA
jgi:hypothetical protein